MNNFKTKYQFWHHNGEGYSLTEFDNLNDIPKLIEDSHTSVYYITQKVNMEILEVS